MIEVEKRSKEETTVALLYGGISGEREISLKSGENVMSALRAEGFTVIPVDTGKQGFVSDLISAKADIAFICLHGVGGEDGSIQGLCEIIKLPYTGSGILASSLAMDKERSKLFYHKEGLLTPRSIIICKGEPLDPTRIINELSLPLVIKPVSDGSSLGVSIVRDLSSFGQAIESGFSISDFLMAEQFIAGIELTVAVLGNYDSQALPPIEIIPANEFYDFESKYEEGGSRHICPARIGEQEKMACQNAAIKAHKSLGCRGVSRTDIILDQGGNCWVIETNTIPGMTGTSLLPHAAQAAGISLGELYCMLIDFALEDQQEIKRDQQEQESENCHV